MSEGIRGLLVWIVNLCLLFLRSRRIRASGARLFTARGLGSRRMSLPILYSFRRCPYAIRARMALFASGVELEIREVALKARPEELRAISPKATVPVVLLPDGKVIDESSDIVGWALGLNDPEEWLPKPEEEAETRRLISLCDGEFKDHLNRYKYDTRYEGVDRDAERGMAESFVAEIEARKQGSGFILRDRPSLVDISVFSLLRQFARADLEWFQSTPYPLVKAWLADWEQATLFRAVMKKLKPWEPGGRTFLFREVCGW